MRAHRSQLSFEFMAVSGMLVVFLAAVAAYAAELQAGLADESSTLQARALADRVAESVTVAGSVSGFREAFSLPARLDGGSNYSVTVFNSSVVLNWSSGSVQAPFAAFDVRNSTGGLPPVALSPGAQYEALNSNSSVYLRRA